MTALRKDYRRWLISLLGDPVVVGLRDGSEVRGALWGIEREYIELRNPDQWVHLDNVVVVRKEDA